MPIERLRVLWTEYPTVRLGQLLVVLSGSQQRYPLSELEDHGLGEYIVAAREKEGLETS